MQWFKFFPCIYKSRKLVLNFHLFKKWFFWTNRVEKETTYRTITFLNMYSKVMKIVAP